MITDLSITSKVRKYVNDVSIAEELSRNSVSTIQSNLDAINAWSSPNWMKLNAKKCRNCVCFFKEKLSLQPLQNDGNELESVSSHKVLGLVIQSNLKWNERIDLIISKDSKRSHILRVLRCGGVPPKDLLLYIFCLDTFCIGVLLCCVLSRNFPLPIRGGRTCPEKSIQDYTTKCTL